MIGVILDFIDNKNIKSSIYKIFKGIIILLITMLIYYIVMKVTSTGINKSHHIGMIYWLHSNADYTQITINLLKFIFKDEIWTILFLAVSFIYSLFYFKNIKERILVIIVDLIKNLKKIRLKQQQVYLFYIVYFSALETGKFKIKVPSVSISTGDPFFMQNAFSHCPYLVKGSFY